MADNIMFILGWVFLLAAWIIKGKTDKRMTIKLMFSTASLAFFVANAICYFVK
jgi:hypothetical protein